MTPSPAVVLCWLHLHLRVLPQLEQLPPAEAGLLLAALFDECGADVVDEVAVRPRDALFTTADSDYNSELQVLEALLDQGMHAPTFVAPGLIAAGEWWQEQGCW